MSDALKWLKRYNIEYKKVKIDLTRLDWIGDGQTAILETKDLTTDTDIITEEDACKTTTHDNGPCPIQQKKLTTAQPTVKDFGSQDTDNRIILPPNDDTIQTAVKQAVDNSKQKKGITVEWPTRSQLPVNEYGHIRIFARAFPWLFPGGIGDIKDFEGDIKTWGDMLLRYEDGRFATDNFFVFFALNYITRHRNSKSGNWFIKEFNEGGPDTLQEL